MTVANSRQNMGMGDSLGAIYVAPHLWPGRELELWRGELVRAMAEVPGLGGPSVLGLLMGEVWPSCAGLGQERRGVCWVIDGWDEWLVEAWWKASEGHEVAGLWAGTLAELGRPGHVDGSVAGALLGGGLIAASAGVSGEPLVGMGLAQLREELVRSRTELSEKLAQNVGVLCARPDRWGRALDGLVVREAFRAGYGLVVDVGTGRLVHAHGVRGLAMRWMVPGQERGYQAWAERTGLGHTIDRARDLWDGPLGRLWGSVAARLGSSHVSGAGKEG